MVASHYNNIFNNTIADSGIGNRYDYSRNNTIFANLITQSSVGFHLKNSSDNVIYHNDIIDNEQQVQNEGSVNTWDNGYPSGGNYWSNYNGTDLSSGFYQNETGNDGIGDKRYVIDVNNQDNFPLWFPWSLPPDEHELTVFLDSPTIIPSGYPSLLEATVVNKGLNNETSVELLLIIKANVVNSTTISFLQAGSSHTIKHHWMPTIEGTYNITAYTPPVPEEEIITNNIVTKIVTVSTRTSIYIHPPESTIKLNETFTVNINLNAVEDLYAWQVTLYFDPAIINCTSASLPPNHIFVDRPNYFTYWIENAMGYVTLGLTLLGQIPTFTGSGILCQITFKAIGLGTSDLTFQPYADYLPKTSLVSSRFETIPDVILIDGVVEVKLIPGDINRDGKVDIKDIAIAASAFGSVPEHPRWNPIADINQDGKVDIKDLALIAKNFGKTSF
jgi:parallel beta-helix repeat protein